MGSTFNHALALVLKVPLASLKHSLLFLYQRLYLLLLQVPIKLIKRFLILRHFELFDLLIPILLLPGLIYQLIHLVICKVFINRLVEMIVIFVLFTLQARAQLAILVYLHDGSLLFMRFLPLILV